ncbi:TPA: hypothetical protein DEP21_00025 [Patescibacteria group bacterium]|nr:hypothetical protein [Candidatus Gracilibacteria bacterium]
MAKPTAFIDIALFGLLLVALRFNNIIAIGLGIAITGITGIMKIANAPDLLSVSSGKRVALIGLLITIIGIIKLFLAKKEK